MILDGQESTENEVSLSARRAWIEIIKRGGLKYILPSLSARRAWIEMVFCGPQGSGKTVALRKESVDRNSGCPYGAYNTRVALRKESVDRNIIKL